ncbi:glycosyltransferase [Paenibacillus sp. LHD-38]|uniref:glycosyltransferase family protein n=1 Tax=Paenibacillus sp. LHD-38 TaxID=3072143 RepID=UPI00280DB57A|nr:glycosyltransferase [Paenibacillus sp. LHD-38]MDQ8735762.1 glycosyltransferase [Paenibacillus sp. LHD-38]
MRVKRNRIQKARKPKKAKKIGVKLVRTQKRRIKKTLHRNQLLIRKAKSKKTLHRNKLLIRKAKSKKTPIINEKKLKILVLTKPNDTMESDYNLDTIKAMENFAEIRYWTEGGSMLEVLKQFDMKPDFILYYDLADVNFVSVINEVEEGGIPTGYYAVNDHVSEMDQITYIQNRKIDLFFTENHNSFAMSLPEYEGRVRLLPPAMTESNVKAQQIISYIEQLIQNTIKAQLQKTNDKKADVPPQRKTKVLILIKPFNKKMPKHQHKYDFIKAIEKVADVQYWHRNGDILDILKKIKMKPDFIFHYDIAWNYAFSPNITNLNKVKIPLGCYVMDVHWNKKFRSAYFHKTAKPDLIFSASKYPFLKVFPECKPKFRWSPFAINPKVIKDYKLRKNIKFSLLGLIQPRYKFRKAVLRRMRRVKGFINFKHPGHKARARRGLLINSNYAKVINRSQISFTCGSDLKIPVAKFFELPGCKTLMLAEPNRDLKGLGFKDKVNYIACSRKNFYRKALSFQKNKRARARITRNGYNFIRKYHTIQVRAQQFVAEVRKIL